MLSATRGTCHSIFAYDIALSINLDQAEQRLGSAVRETIRHKRRAPKYFEYTSAPLRIAQVVQAVRVSEAFSTDVQVELVVYDFGAVSVIYRISIDASSDLLLLSEQLYENAQLLADSRRRVEELMKMVEPALSKASISGFVEDYVIFQIEDFAASVTVEELTGPHALNVAQILRAESRELSTDEVGDAISHRISFAKDDVSLVDWNAALVVDKNPEDVLTVLEFANVQLLEMRFLDHRLDDALERAYHRMSKRARKWFQFRSDPSDLRAISHWQVDSAILFEGVNNVLKLFGDQYLARLYRLAAQRFHVADWDSSIRRKLETLESIYQKISDQVVTHRMEVLEWIIIILITISIILPFVSQGAH